MKKMKAVYTTWFEGHGCIHYDRDFCVRTGCFTKEELKAAVPSDVPCYDIENCKLGDISSIDPDVNIRHKVLIDSGRAIKF